tara:strand:+ start:3792 stop:4415 length:624 start_codon:yes stop_codon:yes gene_type:complete
MIKEKINPQEQGINIALEGVNLGRPIPGQSLTNDPNSPRNYEKPPKHSSLKAALNDIFIALVDENVFPSLIKSLRKGVPVVDLASGVLMEGFRSGKFNPDLMLLLAEPVIYLIMVLAARAGVKNYRINVDKNPLDTDKNPKETIETLKSLISLEAEKASEMKNNLESADMIPEEIEQQLESIDFPSLLAKREKKETTGDSLLTKRSK